MTPLEVLTTFFRSGDGTSHYELKSNRGGRHTLRAQDAATEIMDALAHRGFSLTLVPYWRADSWYTGKWCHVCTDGTRTAHELADVCGDERHPTGPMPPPEEEWRPLHLGAGWPG